MTEAEYFMVNAIWEEEILHLPSFASGQQSTQLEYVTDAVHNVLNWSDTVIITRMKHHEIAEYQKAMRKC